MREQGGGRIINIGSVAGEIPAPLAIPYAATKVGMHAATDALRLELRSFGIHCLRLEARWVFARIARARDPGR
jgi:short-subunit dehydrogenase